MKAHEIVDAALLFAGFCFVGCLEVLITFRELDYMREAVRAATQPR